MKIHIFINCYWGNGMSGGDRRTIEMLRRWSNTAQYEFIVYTTHSFADLLRREGIDRYKIVYTDSDGAIESGLIKSYFNRTVNGLKLLKDSVKSGDVLYSSTDILPDVIPTAYVKRYSKEGRKCKWIITTYHIFEKFYKRPGNIIRNFLSCYQQKYAIRLGKKYADLYLTTSPIVRNEFARKHFDMTKVRISTCAVDINGIDAANEDVKEYDACFLARLNYSKGVFELPEIWMKVVEKYPNARLAIMGKGSDDFIKELNNKIIENHVENNIDLLGYVSSTYGWSIIKRAKCFLFTSHEEGWGMAVAEALTAGTPVVAYDLPVFEKLFPQGTVLCEFKNTDMMAENVCKLLENERYRDNMSETGSKYIRQHYTLDSMADLELKYILD